jgi:hypothetical protein
VSYLAAISAKSGNLLWEDTAPVSGIFSDIAVSEGRILGAINSGSGPTVRAYDLLTGNVEWDSRPIVPAGMQGSFFTIGQTDAAVFVGGSFGFDFPGGGSEFWVQAYDACSGALLWDDRSHQGSAAVAVDLVIGKSRLFVAGYTESDDSFDWVIRAYDRRTDAVCAVPSASAQGTSGDSPLSPARITTTR